MNITHFKNTLLKIEPIVFLVIVCLNLYPLFGGKYFPFMDAPAHLYNANLVKQLAFNHNSFLESYIKFNSIFVPNWFCHIIMSPLMLLFSASTTEKILLACFFTGLPAAARYCISTINKDQKYIALLIVPFTYNFLTMIGFYNFSLGLIFMFLIIGFFYKNFIRFEVRPYSYFILFALLLTTYLCHIVVLGITILYLFFIYVWHLIATHGFETKKWFSGKTLKLLLAVVPIILLMGIYYKSVHSEKTISYTFLSKQELFNYFKDGRIFTVFNGNEEQNHSNFLALFYLGAFFISVYLLSTTLSKSFYKQLNFYFLSILLVLLVLYLILPDGDGLAGYVSIRISILIFILTSLFIASCGLNNTYLVPLCILMIFIHFKRLHYYKEVIKQNSLTVESVVEQSKFIEENSFVLPFKYDDNWLSGHYSNYLGINKPIICFENYECGTGYFPLAWKYKDQMWDMQQSLSSFQNIEQIKKKLNAQPIYYWVLGDLNTKTDSVSVKFKQALSDNCTLINTTNISSLYKLK